MLGLEQAGFLLSCVFRFFQLNFFALMGFCSIPTHFLGVPSVARVRSSCPAVVGCAGLAAGTLGGAVATGRESVPSESVLLIQALARALGGNPKNTSRRLVPRL